MPASRCALLPNHVAIWLHLLLLSGSLHPEGHVHFSRILASPQFIDYLNGFKWLSTSEEYLQQ